MEKEPADQPHSHLIFICPTFVQIPKEMAQATGDLGTVLCRGSCLAVAWKELGLGGKSQHQGIAGPGLPSPKSIPGVLELLRWGPAVLPHGVSPGTALMAWKMSPCSWSSAPALGFAVGLLSPCPGKAFPAWDLARAGNWDQTHFPSCPSQI